jgi:cbb3-type cytochrome oxidase maturation protein
MFYYIPFLFLVFLGLAASTAAFVWAYRSGQFSDQGRAGFLPLRGSDPAEPDENRGRDVKGPYVLFALLASAVSILLFTLILALLNRNGG